MKQDNFKSPDYYSIDNLLSDENILVRDSVREWVRNNASPIIEKAVQDDIFPKIFLKGISEIGGYGAFLPEKYGGSDIDFISYGLMMQELERCDSSLRVLSSVQSSLVMKLIYDYGKEGVKSKYLNRLAKGELIGCFGMTEPSHGSDPSSMQTKFKKVKNTYVINGTKLWIGQAPICDLALVWAKNKESEFGLFLLERNNENFKSQKIQNKWGFRASETGELIFENLIVDEKMLLFKTSNMVNVLKCLNLDRYAVSWGALGIAMDCYNVALNYSNERTQFGRKISSFQLIQKKLVDMITEITKVQIMVWRLGKLMNAQQASYEQISMAKRTSVNMASDVARSARSILGGMGITSEYPIMRHILNLEVLKTYQGTEEIHTLITGKSITGIPAFR
ncbi:MAG: acyl-CoA dehydrogenase family protein [Bacteroidota bacterium]|nr:acyl-CoA dehydrogenase family protein [Bacteroidota bacterium]MEC8098439.1 acyl-CoA dehydrogenase family protein [Bacteroidota bacterium]